MSAEYEAAVEVSAAINEQTKVLERIAIALEQIAEAVTDESGNPRVRVQVAGSVSAYTGEP